MHDIELKFNAVIRLLLYVMLFWLPYSPAVIETCVILSVIVWLVKRIWLSFQMCEGNRFVAFKPAATPLNTPIAFFLLACLLSSAGSIFFPDSVLSFINKTLEWFVVYFLVVEVFTERKHFLIFLGVFLLTSTATAIDSLVQFYWTHKDFFMGHKIIPGDPATAGFKTTNDLGAYLTFVVALLVLLPFWGAEKRPQKILFSAMLVLAVWAMFVSMTRGAFLGIALAVLGVAGISLNQKNAKWRNCFFAVGVLVAVLFVANLLQPDWLSRWLNNSKIHTADWRLTIWQDTIAMTMNVPLFGNGINTFMVIFQDYSPLAKVNPTYAHNCFIQIAAETGLFGFGCFMAILWQLCATVWKHFAGTFKNQEKFLNVLYLGIILGAVAFLVQSFFDTSFYSLKLSVYFWYMVGILIAMDNLFQKRIFHGQN